MAKAQKLSGTFLIRGEHGLTRIAHTRDFAKRWSEWQAASPSKLEVVGMITSDQSAFKLGKYMRDRLLAYGLGGWKFICDNPEYWRTFHINSALKLYFRERHVVGDWFALDNATLNALLMERP